MTDEIVVAPDEVVVAEETAVCREGTGMGGCEDVVLVGVDECRLASGRRSPKEKDDVVAVVVDGTDDGVGECFPALVAVTEGLVLTDGETGVEEEDALACPACEVAGGRDGGSGLGVYFLEDVLERGRKGYSVSYAETESVCLSGSVIGVLAEDDDLDLIYGSLPEGVEDERAGRIADLGGVLLSDKVNEFEKIVFLKLIL